MRAVGIALVVLALGCARGGPTRPDPSTAVANTADQNKELAGYLIETEYPAWNNPNQIRCLDKLWYAESRWDQNAVNKRSGACGISQSLPCDKMADYGEKYGVDYRTNPWPQIAWGLHYIKGRYGSPCKAWAHSKAVGGY